jgi:predicted RNA-binding protein YlqC (UPF0109 family)
MHHALEQGANSEWTITDLIAAVGRSLANVEDGVSIETSTYDGCAVLCVRVTPCDIGKAVSRQGRTSHFLGSILAALGIKAKRRFSLGSAEDE